MDQVPKIPGSKSTSSKTGHGIAHAPGLEKVTDTSIPPGIPHTGTPPPQPLPDFKRERRNQRLVCCLVVIVTLVMSGLGGIVAYYLFFKLPQPF